MKPIVTLVLVVLAAALWASFLGIGFGTGSLSVASAPATGYTQSPTNIDNGLIITTEMTSVQNGGQDPFTSALPGGNSVPVDFQMVAGTGGNCGNAGNPTFMPGSGVNYAFYSITFNAAGSNVPIHGTLDGQPFSNTSVLVIPQNQTGGGLNQLAPSWCWYNAYTGGNVGSANVNDGTPSGEHTLILQGEYPVGTLTISLVGQGTHCDGSGGITGACQAAAQNGADAYQYSPNGAFGVDAWASVIMQSGAASFSILSQGVYNGQTLQVSVTTGYDGPSAYSIQVNCPALRACAGQKDPTFGPANPVTVPNDATGYIVSWTIPSNAAQNTTQGVAYNTWIITLTANFYQQQVSEQGIAISPLYQPGTPHIADTDSSGLAAGYAAPGDTVTLTITASPSGKSAAVTNISVWVVYLSNGKAPGQWPACGNAWVTTGCPYGQAIVAPELVFSGTTATGTFTFVVAAPTGSTEIGIQAISGSAQGQPSPTGSYLMNIVPAGCQAGSPDCPTTSANELWQVGGPILFVGAILVTMILVALYAPIPLWARVAVPAVVTGAVILLIYLSIPAQWFVPGGVL